MNHDFNNNRISRNGRSKIVRTLAEFSGECGMPLPRLKGIAASHPLPSVEFEIYKKGNLTDHYVKADLEKWLAGWRAKTAKKLEGCK